MLKPKLFPEYEQSGCYICTCDLEQKETVKLPTPDGEITFYTPQRLNNNHRTAHPNVGKIVQTHGNTQFKVGQEILCLHQTFQFENKTSKHFYEKDGVQYYRVYNQDVMFGIEEDGELTPREGILLCEPIKGSLVDMPDWLEAPEMLTDYRRDVAKVIKVWEGCEEYKPGDYVFLEKGGDYLFEHNKKDYIKSNHYFDDIMGVIDSPKWRNVEVMYHAKDHSTKTDKNT